MGKKQEKELEPETETETAYNPNTDFDLNAEAKEPGLIPNGTYHGNIIGVKHDPEKNSINWKTTLAENGGMCSDGETPIDGATLICRNWLPRPGDEKIPTKDGRSNKRQTKINMLASFAKDLGVQMNTMPEIMESIDNGEWIGLEVELAIETREWDGRVFNDIKKMYVLS